MVKKPSEIIKDRRRPSALLFGKMEAKGGLAAAPVTQSPGHKVASPRAGIRISLPCDTKRNTILPTSVHFSKLQNVLIIKRVFIQILECYFGIDPVPDTMYYKLRGKRGLYIPSYVCNSIRQDV